MSSSETAEFHSELDTQITLLLVVKINISVYILSQLQNNRRDSGCVSYLNDNMLAALPVSLCVC